MLTDLRVERLYSPRGITDVHPEFTWILKFAASREQQTACEIEVEAIAPDSTTKIVWQSGKLSQKLGNEVRYAGQTLQSRAVYRWRVRVWDSTAEMGCWSDWATFETGILASDCITTPWISGGNALRGVVSVAPDLARARAYVSGLGYYEFFCNGAKVSAAALAPSMTEFEQRIEYEVVDLTPHLSVGINHLGFLLADGWWRHGEAAQTAPCKPSLKSSRLCRRTSCSFWHWGELASCTWAFARR